MVRVETSRRPINTLYFLHGQVLEALTNARFFFFFWGGGGDISTALSWNANIDKITGNANLGLSQKKLKTKQNSPG